MPELSVLIEGGKATAAAPLGPALGPLGVNIGEIVNQINAKTKAYAGMKVPVKISIDAATKGFEISVGTPPMSALIKKELKLDKASSNPKLTTVGDLSIEQVKKIAEMKADNLGSTVLKASAKQVVGACDSMGVTVDGKKARQVQQLIDEGKYDSAFGEAGKVAETAEQVAESAEKAVEEVKETAEDLAKAVASRAEEEPAEEKKKEKQPEAGVKEAKGVEVSAEKKLEVPREEQPAAQQEVQEEKKAEKPEEPLAEKEAPQVKPADEEPAEKPKKESYTQHIMKIKAQMEQEKSSKKKVETEKVDLGTTEITKPKKKSRQ